MGTLVLPLRTYLLTHLLTYPAADSSKSRRAQRIPAEILVVWAKVLELNHAYDILTLFFLEMLKIASEQ